MNIVKSTKLYEEWLGGFMPLLKEDLEFKHQQMATEPFMFFRATYFRWAQRWPKVCAELAEAPEVLSVGDLHVENFGTWRDLEGRLIWGVNDFDEAATAAYTNDLVRLCASVRIAIETTRLSVDVGGAAEAILAGYQKGLETGGKPFVLEEHHPHLRRLATSSLRDPERFWEKLDALPRAQESLVEEAYSVILRSLPSGSAPEPARSRRAGLGSLGRPRFVALAGFEGGRIAREGKAMAPSAAGWAAKKPSKRIRYEEILERAIRCNDPFVSMSGSWLVRRLAPHCSRISLDDLPKEREEALLLEAMGFEVANIHCGTPKAVSKIKKDLRDRPKRWLEKAAADTAADVADDFAAWKQR